MSAHLYWRVNFSGNNGNNPAICELAMHTSVGGADVCTGGTAGGTSINASFPASNAFDGNLTGTDCQTTATPSTISYQFASAQAIVEYVVTASATLAATYAPAAWTFEYSDDGSTWVIAAYVRGQVGWLASESRTFPVNAGAATAQQIKALRPAIQPGTANAGGSIQIGRASTPGPKTVSGIVKVNGTVTAGLIVCAHAKVTKELLGTGVTASDGSYSIKCGNNFTDVYVVAFDPATFQALVCDQVLPA